MIDFKNQTKKLLDVSNPFALSKNKFEIRKKILITFLTNCVVDNLLYLLISFIKYVLNNSVFIESSFSNLANVTDIRS